MREGRIEVGREGREREGEGRERERKGGRETEWIDLHLIGQSSSTKN